MNSSLKWKSKNGPNVFIDFIKGTDRRRAF